jgi:hypothetical protein
MSARPENRKLAIKNSIKLPFYASFLAISAVKADVSCIQGVVIPK